MKTETILAALNLAKPALGSNDSVLPILSHFCFEDDILYAYNDIVAIIVEEKTGLECALHGDTLVGLLSATGAAEVDVRIDKAGVAQLKSSSGWVKVPSLSIEGTAFTLPDEEPLVTLALTPALLVALERCMISVSDDSLKPEFAGVTIQVQKNRLVLYASDNKTASRYEPEGKFLSRKAACAVLPAQACSRLLKLAAELGEQEEAPSLALGEKAAVASFPGVVLVSKLLPAKPEVFERVFEQHTKVALLSAIPEGVDAEITKAGILLGRDSVKDCHIEFDHAKQTVSIAVAGVLGSMEAKLKAPKCSGGFACIDPTLVARVLPCVSEWAVNGGQSLVFSNGQFTHIVSAKPRKEPVAEAPAPKAAVRTGIPNDFEDDIPF